MIIPTDLRLPISSNIFRLLLQYLPRQDRRITDQELEYLRTTIGITDRWVPRMDDRWRTGRIQMSRTADRLSIVRMTGWQCAARREMTSRPPWKAMMTSRAVWAIIIAHFTENWGFYTLLTRLDVIIIIVFIF